MKRNTLIAVAASVGSCLVAVDSTRAVSVVIQPDPPTATMTVDNDVWNVPASDWTYDSGTDMWEMAPQDLITAEGNLHVEAGGLRDPMLTYTFSPIDFGAPSTFTFSVSMPIAPTSGTSVNASISGGLNDFTGNGVTLTPNPLSGDPDGDGFVESQIASVSLPASNMGVDVGLAASFGPGAAGANYTYGPYSAGPQAGPPGLFTSMGITTSFKLSGGGDAAALTGFAQIIPEPSSLAAIALGALALRRRRHH